MDNGTKIVLTSSPAEMSQYRGDAFISFVCTFPYKLTRNVIEEYLVPQEKENGEEKFAPYGLRKVESVLATIQMINAVGGNVIAIDVFDEKLEKAKKFGAFSTINGKKEADVPKAIRKLTNGGVDIAIEVIGFPPTIQQAFESVKWGGRVVVVGYSHENITINAGRMMFREIEMKGSLGCGLQDYPKVINMCKEGKIKVKELVTHKFKLEEIHKGFELLEKGSADLIRGVVVME